MRTTLTAKFVAELSPADLPLDENGKRKTEERFWDDGQDGLFIRLRASGDVRYFVAYTFGGREYRMAIGSRSETKLPDAQTRAYEIRRAAKDGIDPRAKFRPKAAATVKAAIKDYLADVEGKRRPSTVRGNTLYLDGDYFATLHDMEIDKVKRSDVAKCLTSIERARAGDDFVLGGALVAKAARSALSALYTWLNRQGRLDNDYNPVRGTESYRDLMESRRRERALTDKELAVVWQALGQGDLRFARIMRLLILTGCRCKEVAGMRKAELDLATRVWVIPANRIKQKRKHIVHLAPAAVTIIEAALADASDERVFGGFDDFGYRKAKLDKALAKAGKTIAHWTPHDLRRTFRTGLGALKVAPHIAELAIGHSIGSTIMRTYDVHTYAEELRAANEAWANHVARLHLTPVDTAAVA